MTELAPDAWRRAVRGRLTFVLAFFGVWAAAVEARLVYLQVLQHDAYVARAERQHKRTVEVPAKRGEILDRNDRVLAFSVDADSILRGAERDSRARPHRRDALRRPRRV